VKVGIHEVLESEVIEAEAIEVHGHCFDSTASLRHGQRPTAVTEYANIPSQALPGTPFNPD
jgi:hypothetical protein